jgi:AmmeMemoRadiSam system protein A
VTLRKDDQAALLHIARAAIAEAVGVESAEFSPLSLRDPQTTGGAFVSIHINDDLRGCVGSLESDRPLVDVVRRCAVSAAVADPRFPALSSSEWPSASVEISVLGAVEPVADISEIEVGRHGLIAQRGGRRGLLLPQVATEHHWDAEEFASRTCQKAGLPHDAWRTGATLLKFEAEVFGDAPRQD